MSGTHGATFKAGLVQMRSGLSPQANLDAAVRLIGEAKSAGADYVQTPEMTNILEVKRERLFAAIALEENDVSLATFRELARKLGIFLHVGSLAIKLSARKGRQPLVPDRPQGRHRRPLRQDPHVRCRSRGRRELSGVAQLSSRRNRRRRRPAVGPARTHGLLRPALPLALPRAGGGRLLVPRHSLGVHQADRRGALACARPRPRDRERRLRAGRRAGRRARERPRDLRPFPRRRSVGPRRGGRRHRAGRDHGHDRSGRGHAPRARKSRRCSTGAASR